MSDIKDIAEADIDKFEKKMAEFDEAISEMQHKVMLPVDYMRRYSKSTSADALFGRVR